MFFNDLDQKTLYSFNLLINLLFHEMVNIWNSYLIGLGISLWILISLVVIANDFSDCKQVWKSWFQVSAKELRNLFL